VRSLWCTVHSARGEIIALHTQLDEQHSMARHAEQIRRDVDATAGEYDKKLKQLRDALGKAEVRSEAPVKPKGLSSPPPLLLAARQAAKGG